MSRDVQLIRSSEHWQHLWLLTESLSFKIFFLIIGVFHPISRCRQDVAQSHQQDASELTVRLLYKIFMPYKVRILL